jgi:integrase
MGTRRAGVPERARQALDARRHRAARDPARSRGGQPAARAGGLPAIPDDVTPHTLRYTCIASVFAAGANQEYVAAQVGHEDVTTTNRIYRYVLQRRRRGEIGRRRQLAMHESAAEVGVPEGVATRSRAR